MEKLIEEVEKTARNLEVYSKTHFLPKIIREDISNLSKIVDEMKNEVKEKNNKKEF